MPDGLLSRHTTRLKAARGEATPRAADDDRTRHPRPHPPRLGVLILHQDKEADRVFELRQDRMTIGRSGESDMVLDDSAVSRVHAIVLHDAAGDYRICDQDSTNGTYVNNQRIGEHVLKDGDEIEIGLLVMVFHQE